MASNLDFYRISYICDYAKDSVGSDAFVNWWNQKANAGYGEKIFDMDSFESFCRNYMEYAELVKANGEEFDIHDDFFTCVRNNYGELVFISTRESIGDIESGFSNVFPKLDFSDFCEETIKQKPISEVIAKFGINCEEMRDELAYKIGMEGQKLNISDEDIVGRNWDELAQSLKGN